MKCKIAILFFCILVFFNMQVFCENPSSTTTLPDANSTTTTTTVTLPQDSSVTTTLPTEEIPPSLEAILNGVEKRYAGPGFIASFDQKSTLKAMEITDTALGKVFIRRPGMMRWEYETPEKQIIITDGRTLWMYRPDDNQVMIGNAPSYFGDGKGANFLSDIKMIRESFNVIIEKKNDPHFHILKLLPKEGKLDISHIYLWISKLTSDVVRVITYNSYGDETIIDMNNLQFNQNLDSSLFTFKVPEGTDILQLED
ncbi:outer membrane lipoprotein carrier protein LolA [Desulfococcaceae bacterium HSG8]|nr:outer membrane lipoprotein carrier protein LolA [Desulfococcaceae bacterium HSG8]